MSNPKKRLISFRAFWAVCPYAHVLGLDKIKNCPYKCKARYCPSWQKMIHYQTKK